MNFSGLITRFQIPDPAVPSSRPDRYHGSWLPFQPSRLDASDVIGREVTAVSTHVGTYGMGGPAFFGLQLGKEWLVVSLWDASSWLHCQGRLITDFFYREHGRQRPWITEESDDLSFRLVGSTITSILVTQSSLCIKFSNDFIIELRESPEQRAASEGNNQPRALSTTDDLRDGVFLSPTATLHI